jgi:hypothetical protein
VGDNSSESRAEITIRPAVPSSLSKRPVVVESLVGTVDSDLSLLIIKPESITR